MTTTDMQETVCFDDESMDTEEDEFSESDTDPKTSVKNTVTAATTHGKPSKTMHSAIYAASNQVLDGIE